MAFFASRDDLYNSYGLATPDDSSAYLEISSYEYTSVKVPGHDFYLSVVLRISTLKEEETREVNFYLELLSKLQNSTFLPIF